MERPIIILLLILAIPFVYADECCTPLRESNQKMEFDEKEVFLVSDADWRTVLSLVPATTWTDETGSIITHPSLVFHEGITYNPFLTIGEFSWYLTVPAGAYQSFTPYSDFIHAIELRTWHESNPIALQLEDLSGRVIATSDTFFPETQGYHRFIFDVEVTSGATYNIVFLEENIQFYSYTDVYSGGKYSENSNYDINMRVYGRSTDTFDADSTMHFIQLYAPSKLTVIGDAPQELLNILTLPEGPTQEEIQQNPNLYQEGPGLDVEQIFQADPIDIFSFWNQYGGVVIVDYDNYKDGLMASVFASYFNMPLIFISTENMEDYVEVLTNRNVYTVGEIDTDVLVQAATLGRVAKTFTSEELRQEYLDLTDTDKIMLVNTNDMDNYMEDFRFPEKSTESLSQFFGDHSLAAPFLAAARQELIFDMADEGVTWSPAQPRCTPVPEIDNNVQLTEDKVDDLVENYLDYDVNYLTIVASPRAIPDSISYCSGEATRHQKDQDYGFKPNNLLDTSMTSYPELSINIDNDINVVFNKFIDGANQLFYSKLDGSDGSFITEPIQLTNVEDAINAAVRSNTDNEVFIVSQQTIEGNRDIYMTKISDDGIRIWPDDLLLSSFDGTVGQAPKIEIDADGNLHVIWMQSGGNSHLMYAKVNGADGTFMVSPTSLTETILPTLPKLDIDANGDVHIVWQYFYTGVDIYYIKLNGVDGSVMVEEMVISHDESGTSRTPDIKSDSEGDIHVIWQNYNLGETFYSIYYTKISGADGQTIIEPFQVSDNDDGRFHYLALSMDSEDNIHIVWDFELLGIKEILYAKINGETGEP
ncbi:MAG: cell wall-binding repeat-containing protein, partial [Nanoarchaeota archaeon]|nr:cell wall-binding repeat-containing protein [Nanoarchaeota archaeon]